MGHGGSAASPDRVVAAGLGELLPISPSTDRHLLFVKVSGRAYHSWRPCFVRYGMVG